MFQATIMPATVNASHFSRFMVRVQLSPSSPRRLRRLMGSRLWEGGELLDIILSRGGKYKEEDANFVMIQILGQKRQRKNLPLTEAAIEF
ncbi:hypothetical protein YC2023_050658 [Brassica napus]